MWKQLLAVVEFTQELDLLGLFVLHILPGF